MSDPQRDAREQQTTTGGDRRIAGYLLVGGASSRFGRDKALVELGGQRMLARMSDLLMGLPSQVAIIGDPEKYGSFGARCLADRWPGEGPLGGIVTALLCTGETQSDYPWNLILSCDMPFLTAEWLKYLYERALKSEAQVVLAHSANGPEPLCACWRTDARDTLREAFESGVRKVTDGIALLRAEVLDEREWKRFDNAGRLFWNMNTAGDYEEARRLLEAGKS